MNVLQSGKRFMVTTLKEATQHTELVVFFLFLTTSLFLGDGKQPFVDAWWALGILTMYGVRYYRRGKLDLYPIPRPIGLTWMALILYYILLTPFSDSAGYSITATVRLIEAYLVYVMFSTISSDRAVSLFTKGLLFVGVVATLASFMLLLVPSWVSLLPPMNLLYATYGHNHLADILLFMFPVAIWLVEKKRNALAVGLLALFTIGMLLTFARGAWTLLVLYLLFLVLRSKYQITKKTGLSIAAATIVVFLTITLAPFGGTAQNNGFIGRLTRQIQKPPLLADGRWEYWRQAIEAIKERPIFGSGPGTFYLQSRRLQKAQNSYSWFAHSFPLQVAVELGTVGLLVFLFLFYVLFREGLAILASSKKNIATPVLLLGTALVIVYGFFEFSLDYIMVWLLVWAALGTTIRFHAQVRLLKTNTAVCVGTLVALALFYTSTVGSQAASFWGNQKLALFFAPHEERTVKELLKEQKNDSNDLKNILFPVITFFHKKNPEVLFAVAQKWPTDRPAGCEEIIPLDKKNKSFQQECLKLLFSNGNVRGVGVVLYLLGQDIVPTEAQPGLSLEDFISQPAQKTYNYQDIAESLYLIENERYGFAKFMYKIGFKVVGDDPNLTKRLWTLAKDTTPGWSYYHVELASLDAWVFNNMVSARRLLAGCAERKDPRVHCLYVLKHGIPAVGSQKDNIAAIPKNLFGD